LIYNAVMHLMCDPDRTQTCNLLIRSQMLYSIKLRGLLACGCEFWECKYRKFVLLKTRLQEKLDSYTGCRMMMAQYSLLVTGSAFQLPNLPLVILLDPYSLKLCTGA
jgi:hypothetical protein